METIFINIAAYNEEDLEDSINSAFEKAEFPENVYVGLLSHYSNGIHPDFSRYKNVKTIKVNEKVGLGLGISRGLASSLYDNQKYYLQIDAHTVFKKNWDSILIKNFNYLKTIVEKPIISTYVPYYYRDRVTGEKFTMAKNTDWEGHYDSWSLVSKSNKDAIDMDIEKYKMFAYGIEALDSPAAKIPNFKNGIYEEQYFISGHFLFTSSSFLNEVKYHSQ